MAQVERQARDWPNLCSPPRRQRRRHAAGAGGVHWRFHHPGLASGGPGTVQDGVVGRGISAQATPQMVVRFYATSWCLKPQVVHIMTGTNDAAGNTGPTTLQDYKNNIMAMVDLAGANGIKVVLASIPPADHFYWSPTDKPAETIIAMNAWLRSFAAEKGLVYATTTRPVPARRGDERAVRQ